MKTEIYQTILSKETVIADENFLCSICLNIGFVDVCVKSSPRFVVDSMILANFDNTVLQDIR